MLFDVAVTFRDRVAVLHCVACLVDSHSITVYFGFQLPRRRLLAYFFSLSHAVLSNKAVLSYARFCVLYMPDWPQSDGDKGPAASAGSG